MSKKSFLEKFEVKTPCSENWNEMRGSDEVRFCSHCSKSVNNLSAMTRKRALKIVKESNDNICVRYLKNPVNDAPVFFGELYQISRRAPRLAAGVMTAALSLSSMAYAQGGAQLIKRNDVSQTEVSPENKTESTAAMISGTLLDPSGAMIAGFQITLTDGRTGASQFTTTNDEGFYQFQSLEAGIYNLKSEGKWGFKEKEIREISLAELDNRKMDISLDVGEMVALMGVVSISPSYENPLFDAVNEGNLEEVINLIARGENVNVKEKNYSNITPLFLAVENGSAKIAETLLNFGAKANVRDENKQTPLMRLDDDATPELVRLLINHGAKINLTDKQGNNALMFASVNAETEVLQVLLDHRADANARNKIGRTALMNAADEDNLENVRALILAGADVNLKNEDGETAWDLTGDGEIAELLERYGAIAEDDESELPANP